MPEFLDLLESQDGKCAICKIQLLYPEVDHDHKTLAIRGILCGNCNRGLGMMQENPEILNAAIQYLAKPRKLPDLAELLLRLHYK